MLFCSPAMQMVSSGDILCACCYVTNACSRGPATFDLEECSLHTHNTVGLLLQKIPVFACWSLIGSTCSRISHRNKTPAISRLLFVMSLLGLLVVTSLFPTSVGNMILHTTGMMSFVLRVQI
jgi:hypothetical protein